MWGGPSHGHGLTGASLTSVTATPGTGRICQRFTNTRWALPAPTSTTCFSTGTVAVDDFIWLILAAGPVSVLSEFVVWSPASPPRKAALVSDTNPGVKC